VFELEFRVEYDLLVELVPEVHHKAQEVRTIEVVIAHSRSRPVVGASRPRVADEVGVEGLAVAADGEAPLDAVDL
jgi:hypothetical protein